MSVFFGRKNYRPNEFSNVSALQLIASPADALEYENIILKCFVPEADEVDM